MKKCCVTNVLKKLAFPAVFCGVLWLGSSAYAVSDGDIVSIESYQKNLTFTDVGVTIGFRVTLDGKFNLQNVSAVGVDRPEFQMVVNGDGGSPLGVAVLESLTANTEAGPGVDRTDCLFTYTTKPGDMAQPLKIFGSPTIPYRFDLKGWEIRSATNALVTAVWKWGWDKAWTAYDVNDLTLSGANITVRTLAFEVPRSLFTVSAGRTTNEWVTSGNPVGSATVGFVVWTPGTNILQIDSSPLSILGGSNSVPFQVRGLTVGTTDVYLQRTMDYANNSTVGVTNYIKRSFTVTEPPAPPEPTVYVVYDSGDTLAETSILNTGSFHLELSEAFTNDVWVRIDLPTTQSNVTFASSPVVVRVPMGATSSFPSSPLVKFSVPDGTTASDGVGLKMTTVVTNGAAAAKYSGLPGGTVYVTNVKPVVQTPSAKSVTRGVSTAFSCTVTDASIVDVAAGMTNKWTFNDGAKTFETNVNSLAGPVYYAFTSPVTGTGTNTVTITATDKDGAESAPVSFTVTVIQPIPKPSVRVVPSSYVYSETSTNLTGSVMVYLSETFNEDVWVSLTTTPAGQSNIVFSSTEAIVIPTGATNALADLQFSIPDGTVLSETAGIDIIPTVTNDLAKAYYTSLLKAKVAVKNLAPKITKPALANLPASYSTIPMSTPFGMQYAVADVPADAPDMVVTWEFDNGVTQITKTGSGLTGLVYPDFPAMGDWTVTVKAHDMDGGVADEVQFMIKVVAPLPLPTVSVIPPPGPLDETATPSTGQITVHLSETFTNSVTVQLNVTPTNSAAYGTMVLATNRVVIQRGQTDFVVKFSAYDGTAFSRDTGFLITPVVLGTTNAVSYFTEAVPGLVQLLNVAPVITTPLASSTTGPAAYTIPQGTDFMFYWDVNDVVQDLPSMSVTWYFGDGAPVPVTGGSGSILHRYTATGDMVVRVVALDKDGGRNEVQFKITVSPSKMVTVDPTGPSVTDYYGMRARTGLSPEGGGGIGYGRVRSPDALGSNFVQDVYTFTYSPNLSSARLIATAYTNSMNVLRSYENEATYLKPTGLIFDSFFFVWDGADQGLIAGDLDPRTASASPSITLPAAQTGVGTTTTPTGVETRQVRAIFSQEWLTSDNYGDINCDGIPDVVATVILDAISVAGAGGTTAADSGQSPAWLTKLDTYNGDNDFEPVNPTGIGGTFDFRPVANGVGGNAFTAITELRGNHLGLNMPDSDRSFSSTEPVQNPLITDEPKTDATLADSDGDGFPDGYEYWFWFRARMRLMTGAAFNAGSALTPADISVGTFIPSRAIELYFEPTTRGVSNGDFDQDGLSDVEELTLGTNPIHWDTDGDGMNDAWEVLRGLNPCVKDSGTANPDGDFMAYATVTRELVTAGGVTYLCDIPIAGGAPLAFGGGHFTTAYHYGDSNALLAAGCAVVPPVGALAIAASVPVNVLLLHYQVLREFGFDPRTAWSHSVNFRATFDRFPTWMNVTPNTKAYTSLDEYLLLKFMAETRMNGATPNMGSVNWASYTTDPLTPDSDVGTPEKGKNDGMPDGWELYVSVDPSLDLTDPANRVMGISPWNDLDGDLDSEPTATTPGGAFLTPRDGLVNRREFGGTDSSARYADATMYGANAQSNQFLNVVSITQPAVDVLWWNKFWPTNPWNHDTDGDGLSDLAERAFMYGTTVDNQATCIQGGGLNPDSMDTDLDALPDGWEFEFKGTEPTAAATYSGMVITNGMDGTVGLDFNQDWDSDGLLNYQEYWTQAVRGFRYDITDVGTTSAFGRPGQPMDDSFEPSSLFTVVSNSWDRAQLPWGLTGPVLHVLLPLVNMYEPDNKNTLYATTDPRDYDTDLDGMDDYYEMYHGLNPLLGDPINDDKTFIQDTDRVAEALIINKANTFDYNVNEWGSVLLLNFVTFPWMTGLPEADVDGDGLRNFEEKLQPNTAAPSYSNTDPTPLWLTDDSNTNSVTARFYHPMGYRLSVSKLYSDADSMFYWPPLPVAPPASVYTFERNEGYDTDNDGVSDKAEMVNSKNGLSDPQDFDDTIRRQAIWFSGTNAAASSTADIFGGEWTLRSFTAELWARPENVTTQQVLLERVFAYSPSDLSTTGKVLRCNFRIGISNEGRVYGMFENAGAHDDHTATVYAYGNVLTSNEWVHIAVKMDGVNSAFSLLVNGEVRDTVTTTLIPANGLLIVRSSPTNPDTTTFYLVMSGSMMVGAKDDKPKALKDQAWSDYSQFYQGYIDEVRIWDGARNNVEIKSDYKRRFAKSDLLSNRALVRTQEALGYSRVWTSPLQLAPELLFHYTFDNLFSAETTNDVATSPRGFNAPAVTINRTPDALCTWWASAKVKSTVYTDYQYVPWIENSVSHLPIFGSAVQSSNNFATVIMTNTVANSVYWTHTRAGKTAGVYEFPNSNNPYDNTRDLVPMGAAFAKMVPDMWDEQGVSGVWSETGTDADFDGLPDWWELYVSGSTTGVDWTANNPGSGMSFGDQYQRDIANGMTPSNNPFTNVAGWTMVDNNSDGIWDSSTPTVTNPLKRQTADSDHDGMPDWWEIMYGLSPSEATLLDGAGGDPDNDGLGNYSEYLISEVYKFYPGLNPRLFSTTQTVSDYFLKAGSLYYGEMFSDHDYMEDSWEDLWPLSYVSRFVYDPQLDADQDGWSSWAECRYGSDPTKVFGTNAVPVPAMTFNLSYNGVRGAGTVLVYAYATAGMEGNPSAVYSGTGRIGAWPLTLTAQVPSSGYIHEGMNYFLGMIDLNNNGLWDAGEPCGVADGFGVEIGWDRNIVNIDIKDYAPNYLRMTMNPAVRSEDVLFNGVSAAAGSTVAGLETRIRIMRKYINGTLAVSQRLVLDKTVYAPRSFIHDGDFLQMGAPGLDWGFPGEVASVQSVVYQVFRNGDVNTAVLTFTNSFDMVRSKAVATYPVNGAYVYSSCPTFKWTMPKEYTAFTLEILKGSSGNPVIYNSGVVMAPVRDAAGNCVWTAPIYAGDRVPSTGLIFSSNTAYAWRVIAMNPKFSTATGGDLTWSDQKMFRLDVNPPVNSSGFGAIQARVKYFGPATNLLSLSNRVRVQAFRNRGFAGIPEAQYTLTTNDVAAMLTPNATNVNAVLRGLAMSSAVGDCYLRAFIDHNTNGVRDAWESWGYANYYGINDKAYAPFPVKVEFKSSILVYDICIEDADTDQDWYPDAWEYQENSSISSNFLGVAGQGTATNPDAEVNPDLMVSPFAVSTNLVRVGLSGFSSALALTTSDMDGDGLSDMTELIMGSNAGAASTSGDGFADGSKVSLGLSPFDFLTLNLTGLSMGTSNAQVQWNVEVQKAAAASRSLLSALPITPAARYEVQYKASLSVGEWSTVADGTVTLEGVQPDTITPVIGIGQGNTAQGFFRVLLKP
jgi:hypothetical protein